MAVRNGIGWRLLFNSTLTFAIIAGFAFGAAVGCSSIDLSKEGLRRSFRRILGYPNDPYLKPIPDAPLEYQEAFAKLEKPDYQGAADGFSSFLRRQPTTNWTLTAQFNWGRALEGLGRLADAEKKYQETAEAARLVPKLQGLALLRQAVMLEALGDDHRSLAALKDAEKRSGEMAPEVALTELPARLAAAYAREGNMVEADRYFSMADQQLMRLRAQAMKNESPEWLPRVLYAMGHRPPSAVAWDHFEESVVPLERSQKYLLQSAEMGVEPWSTLAATEMIEAYGSLRKSIDAVPTPAASELILAAREQQQQRWKRLIRLNDAVAQLKTLFVSEILKGSGEGAPVRKIADFADQFEENVQATLMLDRPVGESETEESRRRKELIRGRAINPKPAFPGEGG